MKHDVGRSDVNITANFKWGPQVVETISIDTNGSETLHKNVSFICIFGDIVIMHYICEDVWIFEIIY